MDEHRAHLTLTLDLTDPIEVSDFAALFGSLSGQYERYMRVEYPDARPGEARIFIDRIVEGSIIASLFPGGPGDLVKAMDDVLIVLGFAKLMASSIAPYTKGEKNPAARKSDLGAYLNTVKAVAKDSDGSAKLETAVYEEGVWRRRVAFDFTSREARQAVETIEEHKRELDATTHADHERVMMRFKRPDSGGAIVGKRSGERVIVERLSVKDLALVYASALAEQRIKHELRTATGNIFNLGFVVDVNVETKDGDPRAYAVTAFHNVVDLSANDEDD